MNLRLLILVSLLIARAVAADRQVYPRSSSVIDVTKPPYSAKGDGVADDSDALQNALNENVGRHRVLYFPRGTYLVSRSLTWPKEWGGHQKWGFTMLRGQERDACIIRLKDGAFTALEKAAGHHALRRFWLGGLVS